MPIFPTLTNKLQKFVIDKVNKVIKKYEKKQKDIFLDFEGDIYFERNHLTIQNQEMGQRSYYIRLIKYN